MKRVFIPIIAITFCILGITGCMQKNNGDAKMGPAIDAMLQTLTYAGNFSGTVLVAKKGKVILRKAYGFANYELDVRNTPTMKFRICSLTKQFTALAILQLQERGLLNVNDPLAKYFPDFPNGSNITIHHLLTHTSGIFNISTTADILERTKQSINLEKEIVIIKSGKAEFTPGDHYSYNNSGYILLTYIIEKVSGKSYEKYMQENIFNPLGMKNSGIDDPIKIIKNRASGYSKENNILQNAPYTDMAWAAGAGYIYSTIDDMYLWDRALYTQKLLSKKSLDAMTTGYTPLEPGSHELFYGYGVGVAKTPFGTLIEHRGGTSGFKAIISRYIEQDICIIFLSNFMFIQTQKIKDDIAAILFNKPHQRQKTNSTNAKS